MAETTNIVMVHGNKEDVTVITSVSVFGHEFIRHYPLDFVLCDKDDPEIDAYLEVREDGYTLHEKEPMLNQISGYESDGVICELKSYQEMKPILPVGIYPLRKKSEKSGEWARFFPYVKINYFLLS